jgi:hypothetical protein
MTEYLVAARHWSHKQLPIDGLRSIVFHGPSPTLCVASGADKCSCIYVYMYVCMCMCVCIYVCMYVCVCMCMYMYVCMYMYMYVCMCMYIYVCMNVCMYRCVNCALCAVNRYVQIARNLYYSYTYPYTTGRMPHAYT